MYAPQDCSQPPADSMGSGSTESGGGAAASGGGPEGETAGGESAGRVAQREEAPTAESVAEGAAGVGATGGDDCMDLTWRNECPLHKVSSFHNQLPAPAFRRNPAGNFP